MTMPSDKEPSLGYWCAVVGQEYFHALRRLLSHLDMDRWYFALVHLADAAGPVSQQQLADKLHLDKASMVRAIDHLSAQGYVARVNCPNDRRKYHLRLLPKAKPVVKEIREAYAVLNDIAFHRMAPGQRQVFIRHLEEMLGRLQGSADRLPAQKTRTPK